MVKLLFRIFLKYLESVRHLKCRVPIFTMHLRVPYLYAVHLQYNILKTAINL